MQRGLEWIETAKVIENSERFLHQCVETIRFLCIDFVYWGVTLVSIVWSREVSAMRRSLYAVNYSKWFVAFCSHCGGFCNNYGKSVVRGSTVFTWYEKWMIGFLTSCCLDAVFLVPSIFCIGRKGQVLVAMNGSQTASLLQEKLIDAFQVSIYDIPCTHNMHNLYLYHYTSITVQ